MDNTRVYICDVDYLYTKQAPEFATLVGGAVYVFIKAYDVRAVLTALLTDLENKNIEPKEIVSITPYDANQEWASEEEQAHYLGLYNECNAESEIVYDDFMAYARED